MLVGYGDQGMPLAGEGAPLVAEFAVTEFAAAIGLSTDAGKSYVGQALELRHRLPRVWRRVVKGDLRAWQARRIAERTLLLSMDAARFVDAHVAPTCAQDRPVPAARPGRAGHRPRSCPTSPRNDVSRRPTAGTSPSRPSKTPTTAPPTSTARWTSRMRRTWRHAVAAVAAQLKDLGSEESLDVRRAMAVGEMARRQTDSRPEPTSRAGRTPDARAGRPLRPPHRRRPPRCGRHSPPGARQQPGHRRPGPRLVPHRRQRRRETRDRPRGPRPGRVTVVPDRHAELVTLRDKTCVFPWCTRPARRCDKDHSVPHARGGPTCPCNLGAACAGDTTGSRPTDSGPIGRSSPAPTSGPRSTATSTSATPPAPATCHRDRPRPPD